ncbi:MAG TPA: hypothetical protein VGX68_28545 [Thermoanaerobaculia bacterium]|jgi:hypothetical protein|nr:hypothetical protein [Thermoanaerobaculia bacterium]
MKRNSCARSLAFAALLVLPGALFAAQEATPAPPASQDIRYEIRFMDLHAAEVLAWDQCVHKERCRVASLAADDSNKKGYLEVRAEPAVQEKITRALAREDGAPRTQSFQVLLLAAGTKGGSSGADVPANAQKALNDLKGFLPFKSYELLDAVWMQATQDRIVQGHIAGRAAASYDVALRFRNVGTPDDRNLFVDAFQLKESLSPPKLPRDLISTSFSLKTGETIVVGTSKVDGTGEALVVLLTAVPSS